MIWIDPLEIATATQLVNLDCFLLSVLGIGVHSVCAFCPWHMGSFSLCSAHQVIWAPICVCVVAVSKMDILSVTECPSLLCVITEEVVLPSAAMIHFFNWQAFVSCNVCHF